MRILLVEDDAKLGMLVQYKLNKHNFNADWARDAAEAETYMAHGSYDLYILDWMMPKVSGLAICRERRRLGDKTPILMLTARDAVPDRVEGLQAGADDYLIKPFAFEELFSRILALSRRRESEWRGNVWTFGPLSLDMRSLSVTRNGQALQLTRREFQLLALLLRHTGQVLTREQIMDHVWGFEVDVTPNAVDAAIKLLRKKVDDPFAEKLIHSVRGVGYRLMAAREGEGHV